MKNNRKIGIQMILLSGLSFFILGLNQCKIKSVKQPGTAQPGDTIQVEAVVTVSFPDATNPIKGFFGILAPDDWQLISGTYTSDHGNGNLIESAEWTDSAEYHYPAAAYGDNLKWIGCVSENGHTAPDAYDAVVTLEMKVGQREGLFNIAYIFTKAFENMLGTNSAAISYPNQIAVPDSSHYPEYNPWQFAVVPAYDWEDLFVNTSGWTGADGIQSIPLNGREVYDENNPAMTLFDFSDTFIGDVDADGKRVNTKMINNTLALLKSSEPEADKIEFKWNLTTNNQPQSVFIPNTPNTVSGDWYWTTDGIAIGDTMHLFAMRMYMAGEGMWGFAIRGIALISFTVDSALGIGTPVQRDMPLLYDESAEIQTVFGAAIMSMTEGSGNPNPDGYIYIYGIRSRPNNKDLVAARVTEADFLDVSKWTFYNGSEWVADISQCAPLTDQISQEMSVSPLPNGQFIVVFQLDTNSDRVAIRIGDSPVGPFSFYKVIYTCPEVSEYDEVFCYNAKAHPHLSKPGELLISYNVNSYDWSSFTWADIYHPRLIKIRFGEKQPVSNISEPVKNKRNFHLSQNYPNPFNATTRIRFQLYQPGLVTLNIFNLKGTLIRQLVQSHRAIGQYEEYWDGTDTAGWLVPSGVYLYALETDEGAGNVHRSIRKMVLMK